MLYELQGLAMEVYHTGVAGLELSNSINSIVPSADHHLETFNGPPFPP